jgi:hypothetical protein
VRFFPLPFTFAHAFTDSVSRMGGNHLSRQFHFDRVQSLSQRKETRKVREVLLPPKASQSYSAGAAAENLLLLVLADEGCLFSSSFTFLYCSFFFPNLFPQRSWLSQFIEFFRGLRFFLYVCASV